jgi:hypothetical protein
LIPGKSWVAIVTKAHRLGLTLQHGWSAEELQKLKLLYPKAEKGEILRAFPDRTWEAIVRMAHKNGMARRTPMLDKLPAIELNDIEKAQLAMMIDCEGKIGFQKQKKRKGYSDDRYLPMIQISNTKRQLVEFFRDLIGNPKYKIGIADNGPNRKQIYYLSITSMPRIYAVLKLIKDYLMLKRKQAVLTIEFIELHDKLQREQRCCLRRDYPPRMHEIYREMKMLNKRGI